jgi:hypothetical protein
MVLSPITLLRMAIPEHLAKRLKRAASAVVKSRGERDALIREAHEAGGGIREIGRLAGLSHPGVKRILTAARGDEPNSQASRDEPPSGDGHRQG